MSRVRTDAEIQSLHVKAIYDSRFSSDMYVLYSTLQRRECPILRRGAQFSWLPPPKVVRREEKKKKFNSPTF